MAVDCSSKLSVIGLYLFLNLIYNIDEANGGGSAGFGGAGYRLMPEDPMISEYPFSSPVIVIPLFLSLMACGAVFSCVYRLCPCVIPTKYEAFGKRSKEDCNDEKVNKLNYGHTIMTV